MGQGKTYGHCSNEQPNKCAARKKRDMVTAATTSSPINVPQEGKSGIYGHCSNNKQPNKCTARKSSQKAGYVYGHCSNSKQPNNADSRSSINNTTNLGACVAQIKMRIP